MQGKQIPLITEFHTGRGGTTRRKVPQYTLRPAHEEAAHQLRLIATGSFDFYYRSDMEPCCGVYPSLQQEARNGGYGYYVCLVCGKESRHLPYKPEEAWQKGDFIWQPANT